MLVNVGKGEIFGVSMLMCVSTHGFHEKERDCWRSYGGNRVDCGNM